MPSGYVFSGEERLEIYISESYEPWGYEHWTGAIINSDGTYIAYIPSSLTGSYAVSAYASDFSAPAIDGNYNCHNDAMITFTGGNVSGVDFTIEKGKTVSGQITIGADAIFENSVLRGWICAYEYDGEFIDMNEMGEGQFSKFFEGETGSFEYELTIPESVENIVLSVRARSEQMSEGAFKSKFLSVDKDGNEKYFEENAVGYIAVDELKPGEKIVAEIKSNILFESDVIKDKIGTLANRLQNETDVLALFNSYKATLDLLNDNYDIIYNAFGNVTRSKEHCILKK